MALLLLLHLLDPCLQPGNDSIWGLRDVAICRKQVMIRVKLRDRTRVRGRGRCSISISHISANIGASLGFASELEVSAVIAAAQVLGLQLGEHHYSSL